MRLRKMRSVGRAGGESTDIRPQRCRVVQQLVRKNIESLFFPSFFLSHTHDPNERRRSFFRVCGVVRCPTEEASLSARSCLLSSIQGDLNARCVRSPPRASLTWLTTTLYTRWPTKSSHKFASSHSGFFHLNYRVRRETSFSLYRVIYRPIDFSGVSEQQETKRLWIEWGARGKDRKKASKKPEEASIAISVEYRLITHWRSRYTDPKRRKYVYWGVIHPKR